MLLNRADALDPASSAAINAATTDGIYVLGGDQEIAMDVLANTPAETAITAAVRQRGVVLGGTSAGAAVESRNMINGYTTLVDNPELGLQRDSTLMWWDDGDADLERGLAVGSSRAIFDQHFYQRGRFGRTLSTLATADERFGGVSPVGVGVDYATGVRDTGDVVLSDLFGDSSAAIVDLETLHATHSWVGSPATLSARRVLTHLMTDGDTYDLASRVFTHGGTAPPTPSRRTVVGPGIPLDRRRHGLPRRRGARQRRDRRRRHGGSCGEHLEDRHAGRAGRRGRLEHPGQRLRPGRQEGRLGRQA